MEVNAYNQWKHWNEHQLEDEQLNNEMASIQNDDAAIYDRFYKDLEFGTGGLRGIIGVGTNRMNLYTVAKASQGYANYLRKRYKTPSVAIAYDSRIKSDLFARIASEVFAVNGILVYIYEEIMPSPALSFAVRYLKCSGGIVITASHNPSKYNGYKVYGSDGCQITTQAARDIQEEINHIDVFDDVKRVNFKEAGQARRVCMINAEVVSAYIQAVSRQALAGPEKIDRDISIVYTPLNGAGLKCVTRCLKENGFNNIVIVQEQEAADGTFPTCPYPNPEVKEALELGLRYARERKSELLLATDPDCDRVGIAVRKDDDYVLLTGNEVGLLLLEYICRRRTDMRCMPSNALVMKSIVTIDLAERIAHAYGVEVFNVLTGFKYIGEQIGFLEQAGEAERFIFGFEESYGYLTGSYVRDKDGVNASLLICEMAAYYRTKGKSLLDVLNELYAAYGYCLNTLHSYEFEGAKGYEKMKHMMKILRNSALPELAGRSVLAVTDYLVSKRIDRDGREEVLMFPKSDVVKLALEGNTSIVIRPSGTEPKIKVYFSVCSEGRSEAAILERLLKKEVESILLQSI